MKNLTLISRVLGLETQVLGLVAYVLCLGLVTQVLGLGLGIRVLGLGLEYQVLVNITVPHRPLAIITFQ